MLPVYWAYSGLALVIVAAFRIVIWRRHIVSYAYGMSTYRQHNWKGRAEVFEVFVSLKDEVFEIFDAVVAGNLVEAFYEFWDAFHASMTLVALLFLGERMKSRTVYWILYLLCPFTAWKHGDRFAKYRCVRSLNHHFKNGQSVDHVCYGDVDRIAEANGVFDFEWAVDTYRIV